MRVITNNCNNVVIITKLPKSESAADFSPQKADPNRKQVVRQESYNYTTCKHGVFCVYGYIYIYIYIFSSVSEARAWEGRRRSTSLRASVCSRLSPARLSAFRRRSCSFLRSSLSFAVKVGRLVVRATVSSTVSEARAWEDRRRSTYLRAWVCSRLSRSRLSASRRRSCSLLRSCLSSAVKVGRLVLRDSMVASKLDLCRIRFSTNRKVHTPREGKL